MTSVASMKAGDTGRVLASVLRYSSGGPIDLTGCDVRLKVRPASGDGATLDGPAVVDDDPLSGRVTYSDWEDTGEDVCGAPGTYVCEWVVTDTSDREVTVPSMTPLTLQVVARLVPEGP